MYDVVTIGNLDYEKVSVDLNLPITHVREYFLNYDLYKKYPIRDLTFEEEQLVRAIKDVKIMTDLQLKTIIEDNDINIKELEKDQLLIERKLARYDDQNKYALTRKYQHFILEPAVLFNNFSAPITKPLDMNDVMVLLSNIALGLSNQQEDTDSKVKITALSKIADIYTSAKMIEISKKSIDPEDLIDLSPKQLSKIIDFVKINKDTTEVPLKLKEEELK
jgi:hypothetical protein